MEFVAEWHRTVDAALARLAATPEGTLADPRAVGKAQLPSTVRGLIFHAAIASRPSFVVRVAGVPGDKTGLAEQAVTPDGYYLIQTSRGHSELIPAKYVTAKVEIRATR